MGEWAPPRERVPDSWDEAAWQRFGRGDYAPPPPATPIITPVATVEALPVAWLWEKRIPLAALTLLDGHPDTGKSTITLDLAARLSKGRRMPDGSRGIDGCTLLLSTEDTLARPVRERLEAADANLDRIYGLEAGDGLDARPLIFPEDVKVLHHAIVTTEARLVVIDPIMGHLSGEVNPNADHEVRRALTPLARVATATGATILMVRHLRKPERKASQVPSWQEGSGSGGGFGIVRAGLVAIRDEEDPTISTLHVTKHNYGEWARPIDYSFERVATHGPGRIAWLP